MSRPGPTKPVQGADGSRKPRQCPEAQTLYNQMRDVEEESKRPRRFNEALRQRERGRQNGSGHSSYLDIPRTTYRQNRSRTGSIGSAGPASTQGSDGGVEESGRKRRGCRNKPLDEAQRLRTAFVRTYVHACGECRQRKVKCTHFDNSELEANYQAFKQSRRTVAPMSPSLQIPSSPAVSYSPGQCPNDMELFGVGSHTHGCPNQPIVNDHEHEHRDDDIVLDSPSTMVDTSRGGLFLSTQAAPININLAYSPAYSPTYIAPIGFDDLHTPFHNLYPGSPMLSSPGSSVGDEEKPLGLLANGTIWECKRGAIDSWTLAHTDGGPHECHARFQNLSSLLNHYRTQHEPFFNDRMVHRCSCCGSFAGPYDQSCTKCTIDACLTCTATWPLASWYYGTMMPPAPSLISGTSTIHTGQGFRNGNGLLSLPSYFGGSNSYGTSPDGSNAYGSNSFGIYGGSSYAGSTSGQTFGTTSKGTAETRRLEHYAPLQHQVSSNHDPLRHYRDEDSISVKPTMEDRPREPPRDPPSDYHHFPRKSPKCSAPPTTFSLMVKSANSLKLNAPCLALAHYLILLLLFSFPSRSSDVDNTASSSLIKEVVRSMGHQMPLVSALCIAVGVLGMWIYRFGSEAAEETTSEVVGDGRRSNLLSMCLVA